MDKINQYHQDASKKASSATSLATTIRTAMKRYAGLVDSLQQALTRSAAQGTITVFESERRQTLLDELITTQKRMEQALNSKSNTARSSRDALLGQSNTSAPYGGIAAVNPWLMGEETDESRTIPTTDIRSLNQQVLQEQDRGLDALSAAIGRQRHMALNIAAEVDIHNDILGEISEEMERADTRLARETRNIKVILEKSNTHWCLWFLIISLLVAIVVIISVPGR